MKKPLIRAWLCTACVSLASPAMAESSGLLLPSCLISLIASPAMAQEASASAQAAARPYTVDYAASKIEFSGTHADNKFSGNFTEWKAAINFDPANLGASRLAATFNTASLKTGNAMYDGTLPQADWFDAKNYPEAKFTSTAITAKPGGGYSATGNLTIRNITKPVTFDFTISDLSKSPVKAEGTLTVNRLDFDLGKKSDGNAEWVSRDISIKLTIVATPAS